MKKYNQIKAIMGGALIDGTGAGPVEGVTVLVKGDTIKAVGRGIDVPEGAEVIDASGMTVMPGLIDAHVHFSGNRSHRFSERVLPSKGLKLLRAAVDAEDALEAGYTTMRCMAGTAALDLKKAIREGTIRGPRILAAGHALNQTFGHGDTHYFPLHYAKELEPTICDGVDECIKAARFTLREGADFIKVSTTGGVMSERDRPESTQFTLEELEAIVQEARHVGTYCAAHAQGTEGIMNALLAGFETIEHGIYLDDECIRLMKENGAFLVPTFSIVRQIIDHGAEHGMVEWGIRKAQEAYDAHIVNCRRAYEAGVKIAAGTDFGSAPLLKMGTNAMELSLLVRELGMTPMEAIVAATKTAAEACAVADVTGTIDAGKQADVIVVDGDPLQGVRLLENVEAIKLVMKGGVVEIDRRS